MGHGYGSPWVWVRVQCEIPTGLPVPLPIPDWKKWDHTIELIPNAQTFTPRVYPLAPVKQKQLDDFSKRTSKSNTYAPPNCPWPLQSSSSKRRTGFLT